MATTQRSVRIDDLDWEAAQRRAQREKLPGGASAIMRKAVLAYGREDRKAILAEREAEDGEAA